MEIYFVEDGHFPEPFLDVLFWTSHDDLPTIGHKWGDDPESTLWLDVVNRDRDGDADDVYDVVCWMHLPEKPKREGG